MNEFFYFVVESVIIITHTPIKQIVIFQIVILIYENICSGTYVTKMHDITHNFSSDDKLIIIDRFLEICEITKPGLCHPNINLKDTLFTLRIIALPINELEVFKRENFTSTAS